MSEIKKITTNNGRICVSFNNYDCNNKSNVTFYDCIENEYYDNSLEYQCNINHYKFTQMFSLKESDVVDSILVHFYKQIEKNSFIYLYNAETEMRKNKDDIFFGDIQFGVDIDIYDSLQICENVISIINNDLYIHSSDCNLYDFTVKIDNSNPHKITYIYVFDTIFSFCNYIIYRKFVEFNDGIYKICPVCNMIFKSSDKKKKYCSEKCRNTNSSTATNIIKNKHKIFLNDIRLRKLNNKEDMIKYEKFLKHIDDIKNIFIQVTDNTLGYENHMKGLSIIQQYGIDLGLYTVSKDYHGDDITFVHNGKEYLLLQFDKRPSDKELADIYKIYIRKEWDIYNEKK